KGMRQKVGIAAALAKEASSLLLDEPLSGLDPKAANEFVTVLRSVRDRGAAVLMATHDIFRSKDIATRIGIMRSGHLVDELDPGSLKHAELEAIYLRHMHDDAGSISEVAS
ncbi:MAG: AAA family ATPase, partial [Myxococcota bacterium]